MRFYPNEIGPWFRRFCVAAGNKEKRQDDKAGNEKYFKPNGALLPK